MPAAVPAAVPAGLPTLRVATYNVRDLLDDVAAVREVLCALSADVVCLQEAPRHLVGDVRTALLARRCGYATSATHSFGGGTTILWGPRVEPVRVRHVPLRVPVAQRRRGVAVLDALASGEPVTVASVHLGLTPVQRLRHAQRVRALLADRKRLVVAGDANEPADGAAVQALGLARLGAAPATYPARAPQHAIDVVLGRGWRAAREVSVPAREDVLARASDHRPRLVELTF